jgi:hypothetical protein
MNSNQLLLHFMLEMFVTCLLYISLVVPSIFFFMARATVISANNSFLISGFMAIAAVASCYRVTGDNSTQLYQ